MAENKVRFLRGTAAEYANAVKDDDTFYYTTDDEKFYVGSKEITGGGITVDSELSDTSTNPVQNKIVKQAIDNKADKSLYGDTTINVGRKAGSAIGEKSTAEGLNTTASGESSHAEGSITEAIGRYSHAEGYCTKASAMYSHAEGEYTKANSIASHAEGYNTTASGGYSHAEGHNTTAGGRYSHAGGYYTKALKDAEFAYGQYNQSNDNTLFSIGDGTADDARHNAFEITTTGGKLHDKDIAVDVSNPNLLINPDFKINQRGVSGTFSETGKYFVDRWRLVSGVVTVNADGTLTLNGTISQIFENAVGDNVTTSVSAGTATYDNSTKTFSITANGEIISWAKLEYGSNATQFFPPDTATELMKCMRYYEIIMSADCDRAVPANLLPDLRAEIDFQFKIPKRAAPSLATGTLRVVITTSVGYITSNLSVQQSVSDINGMCLSTVGTVLTELPTYLLGVTVDTWGLGAFAVDAEIY